LSGSVIASVTKVRVSSDLSSAKTYISVFPVKNTSMVFDLFSKKKSAIRHSLALLVKNQVRRVPELFFYNDDSLEYINSIDNALKKTEDPIKNTSLLAKRKKI
jgi:ribosome-binding factor A